MRKRNHRRRSAMTADRIPPVPPVPPIPAGLASACAQVRAAAPADAVGGQMPRFVAEPASTQEASAVLAAAAGLGLAVVPRGSGTRLNWCVPPSRCDLVVDTRRMDQVLEHASGDLVARVQAGTSLSQLADRLASAGQRLALDPASADPASTDPASTAPASTAPASTDRGGIDPGGTDSGGTDPGGASPGTRPAQPGTVGGLVASGAAGPLRLRFGTPRDLLIGITVVLADGTIAKAGGKVVKNVAGYDLGKLFAGSWGTLGLITEAVFRLHPRPAAVAYVTLDCPDAASALAVMTAAASSPLAPSAAEIDQPRRGAPIRAGILLEGEPAGVAERAARLRELLAAAVPAEPAAGHVPAANPGPSDAVAAAPQISDTPPSWWGRGAAASGGTVLQIAFWPGQLAAVLASADALAAEAGLDLAVSGSACAGVLQAAIPAGSPMAVADFVSSLRVALGQSAPAARTARPTYPESVPRASVLVLHAPPDVLGRLDLWGPVPGLPLMRAIKDQFDPEHRMAPGRFAGGIE